MNFLTDANMEIEGPCAKGKTCFASWWLVEPGVFRGCPAGAGALGQLQGRPQWRNHRLPSSALRPPLRVSLGVRALSLLFSRSWVDELWLELCASLSLFPAKVKVSSAYGADFVVLHGREKGYPVGG